MTTNKNKSGYKKTKVGWIPKEWEVNRLGENEVIFKGKGVSKKELKPDGIHCITYGDIYTKYNTFTDRFEKYIDQNSAYNSILIQKGDVLFAGSGETQEEIGKSIVYTGSSIAYAGGDIIILRQNKADYIFLAYLLNSSVIMKQFYEMAQGNSVVHIYSKNVNSLSIPLPPMREQKKIAEILSTWDEAIETTDKLIVAQEQRKKWLMQQLLTGKTRFSGFTDKWKRVKLGDVAVKTASKISLNQLNDNEGKYDLIGASGFMKKIDFFDESEPYIAIVKDGAGAGRVIFCEPKTSVLSTLDKIKSNSKSNLLYIYYWISTLYLSKYNVGSTIPHIYFKDYKHEILFLPPLAEQEKIATVLSTQDQLIEGLRDEKQRLVEQKRGLMQVLLTGAVRV